MSAFIFIPIAVTIIILAKPLVQLLFQRGAFDTFATDLTSTVLVFLSLQLFFSYSVGILQRVIFAFYGMKSVLMITIITTALNVVLNVVFVKIINPPVVGIALASSIVCAVSALLHFFAVKRELTFLHGISILKSILGFCALACIAGGGMYLVYNQFGRIIDYSFAFRAIKIGVSASIGFAFYGLLSYLFKLEEFTKAFSLFKEKASDYLK
jgi:putative peptidoglycan lipid II flippase